MWCRKLTDHVAKLLNIESCKHVKDFMKKQLLVHKRTRELRADGSNDVLIESNDY